MAACPLSPLASLVGFWLVHTWRRCPTSPTRRRASLLSPSLDAWPTSATMPSLASTLEVMLSRANITTVDEFADMLLSAPTFIANLIRSEAAATAAEAAATAVGMMTDATTTRSVGTEAALAADDMVDTAIAEAMVAEALCMADEAQERERAAEERARRWLASAELGAALLNKAEARTDSAQAERQAAQRMLAVEQAARQMAEQMLAAEAARADAAGDCPLHEKSIQSSVFPRVSVCGSVPALHLTRRTFLPDPIRLN